MSVFKAQYLRQKTLLSMLCVGAIGCSSRDENPSEPNKIATCLEDSNDVEKGLMDFAITHERGIADHDVIESIHDAMTIGGINIDNATLRASVEILRENAQNIDNAASILDERCQSFEQRNCGDLNLPFSALEACNNRAWRAQAVEFRNRLD